MEVLPITKTLILVNLRPHRRSKLQKPSLNYLNTKLLWGLSGLKTWPKT